MVSVWLVLTGSIAAGLVLSVLGVGLVFVILVVLLILIAASRNYLFAVLCRSRWPQQMLIKWSNFQLLRKLAPFEALHTFVPWGDRPRRQLSKCLKYELDLFVDLLVRDFVLSWYDYISKDREAPEDATQSLRDVYRRAHSLVQEVNQHRLITDVINIAQIHVSLYQESQAAVREGRSTLSQSEEYAKRCRSVFPHLPDKDTELDFLRHVADAVMELLLATPDLQCEPFRQILREVLAVTVLHKVLILIINPDFINQMIVKGLTETPPEIVAAVRMLDESPAGGTDTSSAIVTTFSQQDVKERRPNDQSDNAKRRVYHSSDSVSVSSSVGSNSSVAAPTCSALQSSETSLLTTPQRSRGASLRMSDDEAGHEIQLSCGSYYMPSAEEVSGGEPGLPVAMPIAVPADELITRDVAMAVVGHMTIQSSGGGEHVVYVIQFKPNILWGEDDPHIAYPAVCEVHRRYREFDNLYNRLKENPQLSKAMQGLDLPGKRLLPFVMKAWHTEFVENRRSQLDGFLQALCMRSALRHSEALRVFLCAYEQETHRSFASGLTGEGILPNLQHALQPITKHIPAGINKVVTKVSGALRNPLGRLSGSLPVEYSMDKYPYWHFEEVGELQADTVFSSFINSYSINQTERHMFATYGTAEWRVRVASLCKRLRSASESSWRGRQKKAGWHEAMQNALQKQPLLYGVESGKVDDDDFHILTSRFPLAASVFDLATVALRGDNIFKQYGVQTFLLAFLGQLTEQFIASELDDLLRERRWAYYVSILRDVLWPGGSRPTEEEPERTAEEMQQTKSEALKMLLDIVPGIMQVVVDKSALNYSLTELLESVQNADINRILVYILFIVATEHLLPPPSSED